MTSAPALRKVLQLGTYPIRRPVHGGQRRVAALRDAYRAAGLRAEYVAFYNWLTCPQKITDRLDMKISRGTMQRILRSPCQEDVFLGECLLHDPPCRKRFLKMWSRLRPDLVALEQPYAWPSLRGLLKEGAVERPVIVYSGQNVESELKREVYQAVLPPVESAAALTRVRELEEDLIRDADVCVAVSASDAERYAQVGARRLIVARNGGDRVIAPPAAVARWRDRLAALGKSRYAAFVGSAHPPNCAGFVKMLGPALGYLPPDAAIVVAGRVAEMIGRSDFCAGRYGALNRGRLLLAGPVSDDDLAGLMAGASAVLLPIISGGGSNLKTVEALLSGRPVVGTRYAFRSYEDCITAGGVLAADEAAEFQRHVARALLSPGAGGPPPSRFDELTWPHIGRAYVRELLALVESGAAAGGRGP